MKSNQNLKEQPSGSSLVKPKAYAVIVKILCLSKTYRSYYNRTQPHNKIKCYKDRRQALLDMEY